MDKFTASATALAASLVLALILGKIIIPKTCRAEKWGRR